MKCTHLVKPNDNKVLLDRCERKARKGYTTCSKHKDKEITTSRVGDYVLIDYYGSNGIGCAGQYGTLLRYVELGNVTKNKNNWEKMSLIQPMPHLYGEIQLKNGIVTVPIEWIHRTEKKGENND